jgi:hypothetical protein
MSRLLLLLSATGLAACAGTVEPYYSGEAPEILGVEGGQSVELGNTGGGEIVITGEGFGNDTASVVVYFGTVNATVLEVTPSRLRVQVPRGPLTGGNVDVAVSTPGGVDIAPDLYKYDVGDFYDDQVAYVLATNYWYSCFGGGDDSHNAGCDGIAYNGFTGTTGSSEFFEFPFPRVHTQSVGWFGGTDVSTDWAVQIPAQVTYASSVDDLRFQIADGLDASGNPDFALVNTLYDNNGGWCVNIDELGSWYWGGGDGYPEFSVSAGGGGITADQERSSADCDDDQVWYPADTLRYCAVPEYGEVPLDYEADWPVPASFFVDEDGFEDFPTEVQVRMRGAFASTFGLALPEPIQPVVTEGIEPINSEGFLWTLSNFDACFDDDLDGNTTLDEIAVTFSWIPSEVELTGNQDLSNGEPQVIRDAQTFVRVSLTTLSIGWLGGEAYPVRASIVVPDSYHVDAETGMSQLELPTSVLYQFPTTDAQWSSSSDGGVGGIGGGDTVYSFGDSARSDYGYLVVTIDRVTEYRLDASKKLGGDLIFAYNTGDFGFFSWSNPKDNGVCGNCTDEDGDGWPDLLDADCIDGTAEDGAYDGTGYYTCSDNLDNDGDGLIDADDPDCSRGTDRESNCDDGTDNDGDGWTDELDSECDDPLGAELGDDDVGWECTDGVDNDGDGWIDADDPICTKGSDSEDDGYNEDAQCNDGIDNDLHGDPDSLDPLCLLNGASHFFEEPEYVPDSECDDLIDNDEDGYIDGNDPDCEYAPHWREGNAFSDPEIRPETATECYDGVDNDGDGWVDSLDLGCVSEISGELDGFLDDEGADIAGSNCDDQIDNDGDTYTDLEDPDCTLYTNEVGYGDTECNDSFENDGDGLIDREDPDCDDAFDDREASDPE